jgi:hypothetical protein
LFYPYYSDLYGEKVEQEAVWSGPFNPSTFRSLVTSSAREQVVKQLLAGDSVVWVLLESGDGSKDEASARNLENAFNKLKKELRGWYEAKRRLLLGDISPQEEKGIPFKLEFSLIRIRRDDPAEKIFVSILTGLEPELAKVDNEPIAYPFFGRGRVMPPLIGKGINEEMIFATCGFLLGDCACTIKDMNPGRDTLLPVNWDAKISESSTTLLSAIVPEAELKGVFGEPQESTNLSKQASEKSQKTPGASTSGPSMRNRMIYFAILILILAGIVAGITAFFLIRKKLR